MLAAFAIDLSVIAADLGFLRWIELQVIIRVPSYADTLEIEDVDSLLLGASCTLEVLDINGHRRPRPASWVVKCKLA